jgi:hypothetical protein
MSADGAVMNGRSKRSAPDGGPGARSGAPPSKRSGDCQMYSRFSNLSVYSKLLHITSASYAAADIKNLEPALCCQVLVARLAAQQMSRCRWMT